MPAKVYLPGKRKYRNKPGSEDGLHFDSQAEIRRYNELKMLQSSGTISKLVADKKMLRYALKVNGAIICHYVADFQYVLNGVVVTEDVKGFRTPQYKIKKRLMLACYGIEIKEIW